MKKILYLVLGCSMFFAPACSDFLEKNPTDKPSEAIFWQSKSDYDMALTGIYSLIKGGNYSNNAQQAYYDNIFSTMNSFFDAFSDNAYGSSNASMYSQAFLKDEVTPSSAGAIRNVYSTGYKVIARINIFLAHLKEYEGKDVTPEIRKQYIGEATALRGYMYTYLMMCYGEVPIVKEELEFDNMIQPKSTFAQVYQAVIDDFDVALANLTQGVVYSKNKGHMTYDAAVGLKARAMLYNAYDANGVADKTKMAAIVTELNKITAPYSLTSDLLDNFHSSKQETSSEIMFSVKFLQPNMRNQIDVFVGNFGWVAPTRDLAFAFDNANGTKFDPVAAGIDETLLNNSNANPEDQVAERAKIFANRDPRLSKTLYHSNVADFSMYGGGDEAVGTSEANKTGFNIYKLVTPRANKVQWDYDWMGDQDVVIIRWAHILLMKAEAAFETDNEGAARGYLNEVRDRAGLPGLDATVTGAALRERLRNEIRVETCFEGLRYFDMKRWRILSKMNGKPCDPALGSTAFKVIVNPAHYDWPIPQSEIDLAKNNGVNLEQNPNYL